MRPLAAVTRPVPKRAVSLSLIRLDMTVPTDMIMDMIPALENGTPNCGYIVGHAQPSSESGRPRLINEIYIIGRSTENISCLQLFDI